MTIVKEELDQEVYVYNTKEKFGILSTLLGETSYTRRQITRRVLNQLAIICDNTLKQIDEEYDKK